MFLEHTSRAEWLEQRRFTPDGKIRITATEAAKIYVNTASGHSVIKAKYEPEATREFDTVWMRWGRQREPVIAHYVSCFINEDLQPEDRLYVHDDNPQWVASPDMVATDHHGTIVALAEIKTTGKPFREIPPALYMAQMQWQMMCTGAKVCEFVWEEHDNFQPKDIQVRTIHADEDMQAAMVALVEKAIAAYDRDTAEAEDNEQLILDLFRRQHYINQLTREASNAKKQLREIIEATYGTEDRQIEHTIGRIRWSKPRIQRRVNITALEEAHPDLVEQYRTTSETQRILSIKLNEDNLGLLEVEEGL